MNQCNRKFSVKLYLATCLIFSLFNFLQAQPDFKTMEKIWDKELKQYVKNGKVNYKAWAKKTANLDSYLKLISDIKPKDHKAMSKNSRKALYINAYNAFMIKAVLNNPGLKSVQDIKPKIWKQKIVTIAGKKMSLDALENDMLRPMFKDPRIHFAIVCASISCPPLITDVYTEARLEKQLDENTIAFLKNSKENYFTGTETRISKLFQWFKQDFDKYPGGLKGFFKKYAPMGYDPAKDIQWTEYNWNLNSM